MVRLNGSASVFLESCLDRMRGRFPKFAEMGSAAWGSPRAVYKGVWMRTFAEHWMTEVKVASISVRKEWMCSVAGWAEHRRGCDGYCGCLSTHCLSNWGLRCGEVDRGCLCSPMEE